MGCRALQCPFLGFPEPSLPVWVNDSLGRTPALKVRDPRIIQFSHGPHGLRFRSDDRKYNPQIGFPWDAVTDPMKVYFLPIEGIYNGQLPFIEDLLCARHCASFMNIMFNPPPASLGKEL